MDGTGYNDSPNVLHIISGQVAEFIVTHPGCSQYSQAGGGMSSCGLAALNCARIVLGLHAAGLGSSQLVQEIIKRHCLEDVLRPCITWSDSAHLAVDDIHKAPVFHKSLELISSDYGQPNLVFFRELISNLAGYSQKHTVSSCVIITRPPEIIACFYITNVPSQLFVIFDSHPRPDKHPHGAAFIFKNSVDSVAEYLTELLRYDERLLADSTIQWQAQLLAQVSGDLFIARDPGRKGHQWAEATLDASLQVLSLQARVKELEMKNESYEAANKRLNEELSELEEKMQRLKDNDDHNRLQQKSDKRKVRDVNGRPANTTSSAGAPRHLTTQTPASARLSSARSHGTSSSHRHPSSPASPRNVRLTMSQTHYPPMADPVAIQLQRDYDEENRQLERHFQHLRDIQPTFFDCGICFDHLQEDHVARVMPCGHSFCRPCLRNWAVSKIQEHRYPILCPACTADKSRAQDPGEVDDLAVQQLGLTPKQYEVFDEMQLARFSTIIHCRKCLNTIFVDKAEYQDAQEIVCPLPRCGYLWCKMCSQAIEIGGPKHSCDGSSELAHIMRQRGWKHCPGCQTPAEKIDGCNHMTCMSPGCNSHFCYVCGALIVQSLLRREIQSAVSQHYRRCSLF